VRPSGLHVSFFFILTSERATMNPTLQIILQLLPLIPPLINDSQQLIDHIKADPKNADAAAAAKKAIDDIGTMFQSILPHL